MMIKFVHLKHTTLLATSVSIVPSLHEQLPCWLFRTLSGRFSSDAMQILPEWSSAQGPVQRNDI